MKTNVIIFGLIIVLLGALYFLWRTRQEIDQTVAISNKKDDSAHFWKDKYGHEHATLQQTQESSAAAAIIHGKQRDSLGKILGVKGSAITESTITTDRTDVDLKPGRVDTVYYPQVINSAGQTEPARARYIKGTFDDPWLHFTAILGDSSSLKGYTTDTTFYTRYTKGFFSPKVYLDITHKSPYVHSVDVKSYAIADPASRLQVVLFAGAGYSLNSLNLKQPVPVFGLGVGYKLFSLGKQ